MAGIYKKVIEQSKKIETLLEENLGASGRGLHEKTSSVESSLSADIVKKIRFIASVRNKLMHEDGYDAHKDIDGFMNQCQSVIKYLKNNIAKKPRFNSKSQNNYPCPHCSKTSTPRLYIEKPSFIRTEKKRHICVHCGKDMYITGGYLTQSAVFFFYILFFISVSFLIGKFVTDNYQGYAFLFILVSVIAITSFHYKNNNSATPLFQVLLGIILVFSIFGAFIVFSKAQKHFQLHEAFEVSGFIVLSAFMVYWYFKHRYKK